MENAKHNPSYMAKLSPKAREAAESMGVGTIEHYTKTKQKGLPEHTHKKKASFIEGFAKRALEAGLDGKETLDLCKSAGLEKEAFLAPLIANLLRIGGMVGGSIGASRGLNVLARKAITGAEAPGAGSLIKSKPVQWAAKQFAPRASSAVSAGDFVDPSHYTNATRDIVSGIGGGLAGGMVTEPFARGIERMGQKQQPTPNPEPAQPGYPTFTANDNPGYYQSAN